ncbi:MAG: hypothetical protein HKN47_27430 [Pirellulaceae bacterium]|nr:hypothetical protein [Pirellulaceae bacterium]
MTTESTDTGSLSPDSAFSPNVKLAVDWFAQKVQESFADNLQSLTVYGPAVTAIYDPRQHQIHHLIVLDHRDIQRLLHLAGYSREATRRRLSPPLIVTETSFRQSCDVFPLEWLDIAQFHRTIIGQAVLKDFQPQPVHVRLQCERDLRSLDILLQRGILASGGKPNRIDRLEDEASDSLIRVLRGITWLAGDREPLLPTDVCARCAEIVGFSLDGCLESIRVDGRHELQTVGLMLEEIGRLSAWIDKYQPLDP